MAGKRQPVEEAVSMGASFRDSVTDKGRTFTTRQFTKGDIEAIMTLVDAESKRDRNLFPLTREMLSDWISKGQGVVTEVTDTKGTQIIAFMGAHEFPDQHMVELRAAVVDPPFRDLKITDQKTGVVKEFNINERNRRMLLDILFAMNPSTIVRSVRNGASGVDGVEGYYESMRSMGFKRVFEFYGDACLRFEERIATVLGFLSSDTREAAAIAIESRLEQARIDEAGRLASTTLEIEKLREKLKQLSGYSTEVQEEKIRLQRRIEKLSRTLVPHAKMTLLIKPWFDSNRDPLLRS